MSEIERIKKKLDRGQITRREFLSRMSAICATAMVPTIYSDDALAGPKKGGRLRAVSYTHLTLPTTPYV